MNIIARYRIFIIVIGVLSFVPFLGLTHLFDWDEINFAEAAREMIVTGNYSMVTIDFLPFWEKPPFFIWLQALSMNVFGVNEFGARFPNAICGILTLLMFFNLGNKLKNTTFGLVWALVYLVSFLPNLYFKSGIIDPWFNLLIFTGIYFGFLSFEGQSKKITAFLSGLAIGLAVLTKGPVALLLFLLTVGSIIAINRFKNFPSLLTILIFISGLSMFSSIWFLSEWIQGRGYIIVDFINYQIDLLSKDVAGHQQPFYYHFVVVLIGCFPMSILALHYFSKNKLKNYTSFNLWMMLLFSVVMLVFSIVKTKIIHYSSMAYFPLSYFAALGVLLLFKEPLKRWVKVIGIIVLFIWIVILAVVPIFGNNFDWFIKTFDIKDVFLQDIVGSALPFTFFDYTPLFLLLISVITWQTIKDSTRKLTIGLSLIYLTFTIFMVITVPKIEYISQGPSIEFYKENKGTVMYPLGYKSYANLFYAEKKKFETKLYHNAYYYFRYIHGKKGDIPILFVAKKNHLKKVLGQYPDLKIIESRRGFYLLGYEKEL